METLSQWWSGLQSLNQWFYAFAAFFSVFFVWQLISALIGLGGGTDLDTHAEPTWDHATPHDAHDTLMAFKLLSIRSILAFFTLFTWAGALYMNMHCPVTRSIFYALLWGVAAMLLVSMLMNAMSRLTETGTIRMDTCVGADGTVYLDIPAGGVGEVRVLVSGTVRLVKARGAGGAGIKAGGPVRVIRMLGPDTIEVEPAAPRV